MPDASHAPPPNAGDLQIAPTGGGGGNAAGEQGSVGRVSINILPTPRNEVDNLVVFLEHSRRPGGRRKGAVPALGLGKDLRHRQVHAAQGHGHILPHVNVQVGLVRIQVLLHLELH